MKEKKTELRIFTIADWEKEEQYLQKRHRECGAPRMALASWIRP